MNITIKANEINFRELVKTNNSISLSVQTKMAEILSKEFTDEQQKWYVANFYMYMHYDQTNDFPINLDHILKMIGFAHKKNAKRTLENNFIKDIDYKIALLRTEQRKNEGGHNQETIMLNIDTFKNLCMIMKTDKGKEIRSYYIKLENIYNKILKEEIQEYQKEFEKTQLALENKQSELENKEKEIENKQKEIKKTQQELKTTKTKLLRETIQKNKILNRKYYNAKPGDAVYMYVDGDQQKFGKSIALATREKGYSTMSKSGKMVFAKYCLNATLTESVIHHLMDKYRTNSMQEWFRLPSVEFGKQVIQTVVEILDGNLENIEKLIPKLTKCLDISKRKPDDLPDTPSDIDCEDAESNEKSDEYEETFETETDETEPDKAENPIEETIEEQEQQELIKKIEKIKAVHRPYQKVERKKTVKTLVKELNERVRKQIRENPTPKVKPVDGRTLKKKEPVILIRQNPLDFEAFVNECCELSPELFDYKPNFKPAYRLWSKCTTEESSLELSKYLQDKFASGSIIENNVKRAIYRGIKLLEYRYIPENDPLLDYEQFLVTECKVGFHHRISYNEFFNEFITWKKRFEPDFELTKALRQKIQLYLEKHFTGGRVHLSSGDKKTHLFGVYGIGMEKFNFGLKPEVRTNKQIGQFDLNDNLIKTWDSLSAASRETGIVLGTLSSYARFGTIHKGVVYRYI